MTLQTTTISHANGLEGGYVKKSPQEKAKLKFERALEIIKEKLPAMAPLKALLEIDLGSKDGPLYLDAREEPKLATTAKGEPDCRLKIKPEYIVQFAEGKLEPRYGLFKGVYRAFNMGQLLEVKTEVPQMHSLTNPLCRRVEYPLQLNLQIT